MRSLPVVTAVAVLFLALAFAVSPPEPSAVHLCAPPGCECVPTPHGRPVGVAGCLASACHGSPNTSALTGRTDRATWSGSGTCWVAADPHAGAYDLLTDSPRRRVTTTAKQIAERLGTGTPTEDARCLACHTNSTLAEPGRAASSQVLELRREGVSCEACHGNASGWLHEHTSWTPATRSERATATGMTRLFDLGERAVACAGCHVGAPASDGRATRDVNHDMIAAGHPALKFEFAEHLRRLPRHWHDRDTSAERGVREWLIGRVAHTESAARLLADRATRSANDARTPWPEFAEYQCSACHHDLGGTRELPQTRPVGSLPWQPVWPVTDPGTLAALGDRETDAALSRLMQAVQTRRPSRGNTIAAPAREAAEHLAALRRALADGRELPAVAPLFPPRLPDRFDRDEAGQVLHGLAALERARLRAGGTPHEAFAPAFDRLKHGDHAGARAPIDLLLVTVPRGPRLP